MNSICAKNRCTLTFLCLLCSLQKTPLYDSAINLQSDISLKPYVKKIHTPLISILVSKQRNFNYLTFQYWSDKTTGIPLSVRTLQRYFFLSFLHPRACTRAILNAKAPYVSMPVTPYEAVCHRWGYKDKQRCLHTDSLSERTHYLVSSTVKKRRLEHNTTKSKQNRVKVPN